MKNGKRMAALAIGLWLMLAACGAYAQAAVVSAGGDGLNLREQPAQGAASMGVFVSGTPVEILADAGGGWAQVRIGTGDCCLQGYMSSAHLAAQGSDQAAPVIRRVASPYGTQSVVLRDRPSDSFGAVAMLEVGTQVRVIGTMDAYSYVLLGDGSVGCLAAGELE